MKWHLCPKLRITPNFPSHIDIEASSKCQLQCPMCGQRRMDAKMKGNMNFELYKRIIDECVARHVYSVKLSWRGEPVLNPDLFKMVKYAKDKGIKDVAFLTNVEGFDDDKVQELIESGVDWISCSVDGLYQTYDRIRYPAKFEDTVEKIKKIVEIRRKVNRQKPLVRIQTIFSAIKSDPAEYKNFWEPIVDKINFIADQIRQTAKKDFPTDRDFVCQSPWQRMCIDFDGRVTQCHSDYLEKNVLGDVKKQSLYEIWHGEPFKEVRKLHKTGRSLKLAPCRECSYRGEMEEVTVDVDGKKQNILKYVEQELDLETMDARPRSESKHEK
ncbi:radical SAM/SPASM domain-containing protein [Chloroflexota bacterium]